MHIVVDIKAVWSRAALSPFWILLCGKTTLARQIFHPRLITDPGEKSHSLAEKVNVLPPSVLAAEVMSGIPVT